MVRLLDQPDVAASETLDEPQLPQRTRAVEHAGLDPGTQRQQLIARPRVGERGQSNVVRDVEVIVVDPDRTALAERHVHQPAAEPRDVMESGIDEGAGVCEAEPAGFVEERRPFEHTHRADVHGRLESFEVEEARVECTESVVVPHAVIVGGRCRPGHLRVDGQRRAQSCIP